VDQQREAVEQTLRDQQRASESTERIRAQHVAEFRRSSDQRPAVSVSKEGTPERFVGNSDRPRDSGQGRQEGSERVSTGQERLYRSADEIASLRTKHPSELRDDAARVWEPVHQRNYEEYVRASIDGDLERGKAMRTMIQSDRIAPISITSPERHENTPEFWRHHGNDPAFYERMGEQYPMLQEQIKQGKPLEALRNDPAYREAANFWYSSDQVRLTQFKDSFLSEGAGDHRIALAHRYQLESIPVEVQQAWYKRSRSSPGTAG